MQDIVLGRIWDDHHRRVYGESKPPAPAAKVAEAGRRSDPLPAVGFASLLAVAVGLASLGANLATA